MLKKPWNVMTAKPAQAHLDPWVEKKNLTGGQPASPVTNEANTMQCLLMIKDKNGQHLNLFKTIPLLECLRLVHENTALCKAVNTQKDPL